MTDSIRRAAIALYDRFTHEGMDRRAFMAELSRIAGGAAAANALLLGIAASPAAAAMIAADDVRIRTRDMGWHTRNGRTLKGYAAEPARAAAPLPSVMVIHENRGLNDHIRDVTRRLAVAGYRALAPDLLSPLGGTPADEDQAREAIGRLDLGAATADCVSTLSMLKALPRANRKAGIVGFCWGGGMVDRVAVAAGGGLDAAVAYYGPAPDPSFAPRVKAAVMLHQAGLDDRVNATALPWADALKKAGVRVEAFTYPNVNHAFNNDTSAERYDKAAATLAWKRTLDFFATYLRA